MDKLEKATREAEARYGDILHLARPVSKKHPPLGMDQRAAQFSPFAALTGHAAAIREAGEQFVLSEEEDAVRFDPEAAEEMTEYDEPY